MQIRYHLDIGNFLKFGNLFNQSRRRKRPKPWP
jgi:hypothetical protein